MSFLMKNDRNQEFNSFYIHIIPLPLFLLKITLQKKLLVFGKKEILVTQVIKHLVFLSFLGFSSFFIAPFFSFYYLIETGAKNKKQRFFRV